MYKLFLTFRFLTRKKIVIFPILVVWLCLMMMIIVTSIMGGFVTRVRDANRDLFGDIVISNDAGSGWPYYDELQGALKQKFSAQIAATTPVVHGYGLLNLPDFNQTFPAQIVGIDPKGRSAVSRFRESLFHQYISPENTIADLTPALPNNGEELAKYAEARSKAADQAANEAYRNYTKVAPDLNLDAAPVEHPVPNLWWLLGAPVLALLIFLRLRRRGQRPRTIFDWFSAVAIFFIVGGILALGFFWPVIFPRNFELVEDALERATESANRARITWQMAAQLPQQQRFTSAAELAAILVPKTPSFAVPRYAIPAGVDPEDAPDGCIVGIQFPLFSRDKRGHFDRSLDTGDLRALLTVVPITPAGSLASGVHPSEGRFIIVDDSYTGVFDVDSTYVYAPFEKVQYMAGMRTDKPKNDPEWFPPRCNEVLIKLKPGTSSSDTKFLRAEMNEFLQTFIAQHPDMARPGIGLRAQTWDEKQARYIGAVQNEKNMITAILGLMSLIVLVVVFLIFYMIVRDKTRDIGIIKAVGGSEAGVAGIFLTYGLCIGLVGGVLGVICGVLFVTHTNQIHEWIYQMTGHMIWDRSVYLFDRIPDEYNPIEVLVYFLLSLAAGVLGALIPALVAAAEDPVKAVRYE